MIMSLKRCNPEPTLILGACLQNSTTHSHRRDFKDKFQKVIADSSGDADPEGPRGKHVAMNRCRLRGRRNKYSSWRKLSKKSVQLSCGLVLKTERWLNIKLLKTEFKKVQARSHCMESKAAFIPLSHTCFSPEMRIAFLNLGHRQAFKMMFRSKTCNLKRIVFLFDKLGPSYCLDWWIWDWGRLEVFGCITTCCSPSLV